MTRTWLPIQNDHCFAAQLRKQGFKVNAADTEDSFGPVYYVLATEKELDRAWAA